MDKYKVIVADPPWDYNNYKKAAHGSPQYPQMKYSDIAAIPVADFADKDCLLVMWTTWPKLDEGVELVKDWGFKYLTGWPWIKTVPSSGEIRCGLGFWAQSTSEPVIIARRGRMSPSKENKRRALLVGEDRQFYAPIGKHSKKPEDIQTWVENRFKGPYLELFARRERPGWTCWGYDTGYKLTPQGVETVKEVI